jgi:ribose transport system substrate-binding protein
VAAESIKTKLFPQKHMKNHPLFLFAGVVTCSLTLLTGAYAAGKQKTFAIIPKSISISFYNDVEKGCKEEGAKLGVNVIYTGPDTADAAKQVQVLQDLVSRGVDGFAVAPMDGDSVIGVIEAAIKKGIKVITFDADSPKSQRVCFVGTNNEQGGHEAGKAFAEALPKGKFAVITGGLASVNHNQRGDGFRKALKEAGGEYTEIPGSPFPCNDDAAKSIQIIQDTLTRYPDLNGFFFSGGWPLFGAPEAYLRAVSKHLDDIKTKKFVVIAFDTLPEELKILKQGSCNGLIGQRPYAMGVKSVDILNDLTEGKTVPAVVDTGVDVVTSSNVDQFLK